MIKRIIVVLLMMTSFGTSSSQKSSGILKLEGVYEGLVNDGYSFCYRTASGLEKIVVFNEILSVILMKHPLKDDTLIGENFIISYTKDIITEEKNTTEVLTILRLQKLMPGQHFGK